MQKTILTSSSLFILKSSSFFQSKLGLDVCPRVNNQHFTRVNSVTSLMVELLESRLSRRLSDWIEIVREIVGDNGEIVQDKLHHWWTSHHMAAVYLWALEGDFGDWDFGDRMPFQLTGCPSSFRLGRSHWKLENSSAVVEFPPSYP